jgi:hypothetical protein
MRFLRVSYLVSGLLLTGVSCGEPLMPAATGAWSVEVANGLTMPAPTATGHTLRYGLLKLAEDQTGSLEVCTALPAKATTYGLRWRFLDGTRVEFSYFNTTGAQPATDTATVSGQSMNYRAKVVEPDIGASNWRLRLVAFDPADISESCF